MSTESTQTELVKRTFRELMKGVCTSIPGHILAFDPATQLAQVQIGIIRIDTNGAEFTPPPLITVPVHFCGGVNFSVEYEINPGDEGIIIFSQRCIDGWKNTGGVAKNPIFRFHDLSDAVFLPGIRSQPKVLPSFENDGIRLRNDDGTKYIWLKNDGTIVSNNGVAVDTLAPDGTITLTNGSGTITMSPDGTVNINGAIITPDGAITSPVSVTAPTVTGSSSLMVAGAEVKNHRHGPGTFEADGEAVTGISGALA
jgi:phage baseplate assembly protein gpV